MLPRRNRTSLALVFLLILIVGRSGPAQQQQSAGASEVFKRYSPYATRIQVVEKTSGAKSTIGSGFFATPAGHVVTNYHVISSLITKPERYRAELVEPNGTTVATTVLAIDVVHDLAVLKTEAKGKPYFSLAPAGINHGQRLYSLGNPRDLGMSIVEGTYNGLLEHTLYPRIHLTGSLNPGMSGGPTIDEKGRVIGVNVATAGNQVSFLVPVERAVSLLQSALSEEETAKAPSIEVVATQLREHQNKYLADMLGKTTKTIDFGPFRVVTQPAPFFRCWGDAISDDEDPFEKTRHRCTTEDDIYLDSDQTTGSLTVNHQLLTNKSLNALQFSTLYGKTLQSDDSPSGDEEYVTSWECVTRNVRNESARMRAVLCLRRYRKFGELYDANLKVAMLGRADVGLVSTLNVTGVSYENLTKLSDRFLNHVAWR